MSKEDFEEGKEQVHIEDVESTGDTDKAVKVIIAGDTYWIPKSVIDDDSEVWKKGQSGTLVLPRWFVKKEKIPH